MKRLKKIEIVPEVILHWILGMNGTPVKVQQTGMPADAELIEVGCEPRGGWEHGNHADMIWFMILQSASFPEVLDGQPVPQLDLTFQRIE